MILVAPWMVVALCGWHAWCEMHDDDELLETCPFRGGACPDHAHAWRAGVCPDPPKAITNANAGDPPGALPDQGDRDQ